MLDAEPGAVIFSEDLGCFHEACTECGLVPPGGQRFVAWADFTGCVNRSDLHQHRATASAEFLKHPDKCLPDHHVGFLHRKVRDTSELREASRGKQSLRVRDERALGIVLERFCIIHFAQTPQFIRAAESEERLGNAPGCIGSERRDGPLPLVARLRQIADHELRQPDARFACSVGQIIVDDVSKEPLRPLDVLRKGPYAGRELVDNEQDLLPGDVLGQRAFQRGGPVERSRRERLSWNAGLRGQFRRFDIERTDVRLS